MSGWGKVRSMPEPRERVVANLARVRDGIGHAAERAGRDPDDVVLVAAAKTVPPEVIGWAVAEGVRAVGHNYVQELRATSDVVSDVRWHFIGTLQSSGARHVAELVDVVETVTGGRATERLARRAAQLGRSLDALVEVDFTQERSGVAQAHLGTVVDALARMEGLTVRGLMTLPPQTATAEEARPWFRRLRLLRDAVRETHPEVVDLSMGMSLDYEVAIEEGATMVRIGTALFGPRAART
jgi:PLP dependent protein